MSIKGHTWKHASNLCSNIMKDRLSCSGLSQAVKHGSISNEPARKHQSMEWIHMSSPRSKEFRRVPSAGKVMMLFWDFSGPILKHYQDHGQMVSSAWYCAVLEEEFKPATCSKCRGMQ